jgi:hypothetical protein
MFVSVKKCTCHTFVMSLSFDSRQRAVCRETVCREGFVESSFAVSIRLMGFSLFPVVIGSNLLYLFMETQ